MAGIINRSDDAARKRQVGQFLLPVRARWQHLAYERSFSCNTASATATSHSDFASAGAIEAFALRDAPLPVRLSLPL
jgi:hypothetical protein